MEYEGRGIAKRPERRQELVRKRREEKERRRESDQKIVEKTEAVGGDQSKEVTEKKDQGEETRQGLIKERREAQTRKRIGNGGETRR